MLDIGATEDFRSFAPPPPQQSSRNDLGQEDFLTLMITQFQNQDPFKPLDNGDFLSQLAQFSTVSGIESLNNSFTGLSGSMQDSQALQAAGLVGRSILAVTDIGYLGDTGALTGALELESSASDVQIDILDESGALVQRLSLGQQPPGMVSFTWDGIDSDGNRADTGQYQINARVLRGTETESAAIVVEAEIESITLGQFGGGMSLNLEGGQRVALGQIYQIIG